MSVNISRLLKMIKIMTREQTIAAFLITFVLCVNKTNCKSISKIEAAFINQNSQLGMMIALHDPKPLKISKFEQSIFSLLKNEIANDKDEILSKSKLIKRVFSMTEQNKFDANEETRGIASEFKPDINATNLFQQNDTNNANKSKLIEEKDDELFLPPSVLKQEEIISIPSKRYISKSANSKSTEQNVVLKHSEDKKRNLELPKTLKMRIKVAYDQSFNDLIRSFNYSPSFILRYMTQLLKQIFQLPGLDTTIEPDVSTGKRRKKRALFQKMLHIYMFVSILNQKCMFNSKTLQILHLKKENFGVLRKVTCLDT